MLAALGAASIDENGNLCGVVTVVGTMDSHELQHFRAEKDEFFLQHPQSPLPHEARHDFEGLRYYETNDDLVLELDVSPGDNLEVTIATSDGQERTYYRAGTITLDVGDTKAPLTLLSTPGHDGYFLPFRDSTSGKESYGAGRYLDLPPAHHGKIVVDFNYAYNPYCAYSDHYSCALPPVENWLQVPIEAGEKTFAH